VKNAMLDDLHYNEIAAQLVKQFDNPSISKIHTISIRLHSSESSRLISKQFQALGLTSRRTSLHELPDRNGFKTYQFTYFCENESECTPLLNQYITHQRLVEVLKKQLAEKQRIFCAKLLQKIRTVLETYVFMTQVMIPLPENGNSFYDCVVALGLFFPDKKIDLMQGQGLPNMISINITETERDALLAMNDLSSETKVDTNYTKRLYELTRQNKDTHNTVIDNSAVHETKKKKLK
jgi:hypothetical protein